MMIKAVIKIEKQNYIDTVLKHLIDHGTITVEEAINLYQITRLSSCIAELRKKGYNITTERVAKAHENGRNYVHGVYRLVKS